MWPWNSRRFFWWVSIVGGMLALPAGIIAAYDLKREGAILGGVAAAFTLASRFRIDAIDADEKRKHASLAQRIIRRMLEGLRQHYFPTVAAADHHLHRATLFVCKVGTRRTPGKSLTIYARAGLHEQSTTVLTVDDDHEGKCEGIAGRVWFANSLLTPAPLPEWPQNPADVAGQVAYAEAGFLTHEKAVSLKVKSRAFVGTTVRVNGDRWGVLLVDTMSPDLIASNKGNIVGRYAEMIGKAIEESMK